MKRGFTLIELLVVVLIIGILSSVALPQYTKAVEKARATEGVQTAATLSRAIDIWLMENGGFPSSDVGLKDMGLSIELSSGSFESDNGYYYTKNFFVVSSCDSGGCAIEIGREPQLYYSFYLIKSSADGEWDKKCFTQLTEIGRNICKNMIAHGYSYEDSEL